MIKIGLIKEGKIPADNRVALTPAQCKWIHKNLDSVQIIVQSSSTRCFSDREFSIAGAEIKDDVSDCEILLGIKEVPVQQLVAKKTYLLFSHTKKEHQAHLELVIEYLHQMKLYTNLKKCKFFKTELEYLKFIINKNGLQMDPAYI